MFIPIERNLNFVHITIKIAISTLSLCPIAPCNWVFFYPFFVFYATNPPFVGRYCVKGGKEDFSTLFQIRRKGVSHLKPSAFQEKIEHQFDSLCKQAIQRQQKNYLRDLRTLSEKEVSFSVIGDRVVNQLSSIDHKPSDFDTFSVNGFSVNVRNNSLGDALKELTNRKREILLLHYFLEMSDSEIAELLKLNRSTVYRHRIDALKTIKQCMEGASE